MTSALEILGLPIGHRFRAGDDLADVLLEALELAGAELADGDVVCVASKAVSIVEDAVVELPDGDPLQARRQAARTQAAAIVAESPQVVVTRTPHGFVAANGGIDTSNVGGGVALRLPDDPDASAAELRDAVHRRTGREVGIVVTDSFGRPWRLGQTDVALGIAGAPALRDERGRNDLDGQRLEVTAAAVGDELAGAADLVRHKASGTPFVLVRGLPPGPSGTGADLVREVGDDLFTAGGATAGERAITGRRTIRRLQPDREVPGEVLQRAVAAAATAPAPHHTRPWRFVRLTPMTRERLLDAMARRWRDDLAGDGIPPDVVEARIARSDAVLRTAPELLVPFVVTDGAHHYPDERRRTAERDLFVLSGGAALQNLQIALAAHGLGAAWLASTVFCEDLVRAELGFDDRYSPLGMVAVGWPAGPAPSPREPADVGRLLIER